MSALTFDTQIAAKAVTLAGTPSRMLTDHLTSPTIPESANRFQLQVNASAAARRSNTTAIVATAVLRILHRLGPSEAERDYTLQNMLTNQAAIADRSWWDVAAVQRISEEPAIQTPAERVGDVILFEFATTVILS